jgi:AcrR family transcriptional regulator
MSVADIVKAAAVSRNAFYKNFADKQECFATAHDAGHERLFEVLVEPCEDGATIEERVERSLAAGLDALASEPDVARLLFVEAPSAGGGDRPSLPRVAAALRHPAARRSSRLAPAVDPCT